MFNLQRPLVSAGVFVAGAFALTTVMGINASFRDFAMDGAYIAAATLISDTAHDALGMYPTGITSAVGVGVANAAIQNFLRGSNNYTSNAVAGAVVDYASGVVEPMVYRHQQVVETPIEGGVSTA